MPKGMIKLFDKDDTIWKGFLTGDRIILALMLFIVLFSFSLQYALIIGYGGYVILEIIKNKKANVYLVASLIILILGTLAEYLA